MPFEWDTKKAARVLEERAIDFEDVALIFDQPHIIISSDQKGEKRWLIIGIVDGQCVTGVYTVREDTIRIISARRSRKHEQGWYCARYT